MVLSLINSYVAIGEFAVTALLQFHIANCQNVLVNNKIEQKKYLKYHLPIQINPEAIKRISKKGDIYAIATFTPYTMHLTDDEHILLYDIDDEGEIGTIIRTALCFNFKNIVLINSKIDLFNWQLIRASAGAFFMANIVKYKNKKDYQKDYPNSKTIEFKKSSLPLSLEVGPKLYQLYKAK